MEEENKELLAEEKAKWKKIEEDYMAAIKNDLKGCTEEQKITYLLCEVGKMYMGLGIYEEILQHCVDLMNRGNMSEAWSLPFDAIIPKTISETGVIYGFRGYIGRKVKVIVLAERR